MNREALEQLRRVLLNVPLEKFDMGTFGDFDTKGCCTAACAAGWAGLDPWFQKRGFVSDNLSFSRCREFFDLAPYTSKWLFSPYSYDGDWVKDISPDDVIERIEGLLA